MIAFGRAYIANPDLVERFAHDWPLAAAPDTSVWYFGGASGYSDFPAFKP
jgi:2,4-dienoyl-CoA reductase-like NADH-dependent reductase (Old Yellow Enzyme family)